MSSDLPQWEIPGSDHRVSDPRNLYEGPNFKTQPWLTLHLEAKGRYSEGASFPGQDACLGFDLSNDMQYTRIKYSKQEGIVRKRLEIILDLESHTIYEEGELRLSTLGQIVEMVRYLHLNEDVETPYNDFRSLVPEYLKLRNTAMDNNDRQLKNSLKKLKLG